MSLCHTSFVSCSAGFHQLLLQGLHNDKHLMLANKLGEIHHPKPPSAPKNGLCGNTLSKEGGGVCNGERGISRTWQQILAKTQLAEANLSLDKFNKVLKVHQTKQRCFSLKDKLDKKILVQLEQGEHI